MHTHSQIPPASLSSVWLLPLLLSRHSHLLHWSPIHWMVSLVMSSTHTWTLPLVLVTTLISCPSPHTSMDPLHGPETTHLPSDPHTAAQRQLCRQWSLWLLPCRYMGAIHTPPGAGMILTSSSCRAPRAQGPCSQRFDSGFWPLHQSLQTSSCCTANTWNRMTQVPPRCSFWAPHSFQLLAPWMHGLSRGSYSCCWYFSSVPTS